jgi:hypothetical protein
MYCKRSFQLTIINVGINVMKIILPGHLALHDIPESISPGAG